MSKTVTGVEVKLIGEDGNAFAIIGKVKKAMKNAGIDKAVIDAYCDDAMSGDYNHLLTVTNQYVVIK